MRLVNAMCKEFSRILEQDRADGRVVQTLDSRQQFHPFPFPSNELLIRVPQHGVSHLDLSILKRSGLDWQGMTDLKLLVP